MSSRTTSWRLTRVGIRNSSHLIFISYSHRDRDWLGHLQVFLKPYTRQNLKIWADPYIEVGGRWRRDIAAALCRSRVGVLLLSPDFLASDFIYSEELRTALDYLIFELAKLDCGGEQSGTQFPIMDAPQDFAGRGTTFFLKGVNATHVACIERLQPYNGCNWTRRLRDSSNADKHRHFIPSVGNSRITVHSGVERDDLDRIQGFERRAMHPLTGSEVNAKVYIAGEVTFDDGEPIVDTIEVIKAQVAQTLADFKPDF
jgi:hypothetical protein